MEETSGGQFLFNAIAGIGFVASGSALREVLAKAETQPADPELYWLLEQTDDSNQNANLFFEAMLGMPQGVRVAMKQFGERYCEDTEQKVATVVIEARVEEPTPEIEQKLISLGFHAFQQFDYDEQLREQLKLLKLLNIENGS